MEEFRSMKRGKNRKGMGEMIANKHVHVTEKRGVKYTVVSVYEGENTIQNRLGNLILNAFRSSKERVITKESSLGLVMDKAEES